MGLIGWADAPNSIESKSGETGMQVSPMPSLAESPELPAEQEPSLSISDPSDDTLIDDVSVESDEASGVSESLSSESGDVSTTSVSCQESPDGELLLAIRNLRLADSEDGDRCDISKFELHEVKFLYEHAERSGSVDYYAAVREVFGVKHRILDEKINIDAIDSPNLDELMNFVEGKYEGSVGGGN